MRTITVAGFLLLAGNISAAVPLAAQATECDNADAPSCADADTTETSRWKDYALDLVGPWVLLGNVAAAGINHWVDEPEPWDGRWDGYGRRLASQTGHVAVRASVEHGLAAILDRRTHYQPCTPCQSAGQRTGYALHATLFDSTRDGGTALAVPRFAGAYAGAFAMAWWTPEMGADDALLSGTMSILSSAFSNLAQEFLGIGR